MGLSGRVAHTHSVAAAVDYFFIGDPELVTGFKFVGIDGIAANNEEEARRVFRRVTDGFDEVTNTVVPTEGCRILILTQEVADWLGERLIDWQIGAQYPLIVELPGMVGRIQGRKTLVDSIREAIGIHV
ncbi:MAG: ATPase V [Treponema sp.]|nr:ATPase V [Treponema sp.]